MRGVRTAGGQFAAMLGIRYQNGSSILAVVVEQQKHAMQGEWGTVLQTCKAEAKSIGHIVETCYSVYN